MFCQTDPIERQPGQPLSTRFSHIEWIVCGILLASGLVFAALGSLPLAFLAVAFGGAVAVGAWSDSRTRRKRLG